MGADPAAVDADLEEDAVVLLIVAAVQQMQGADAEMGPDPRWKAKQSDCKAAAVVEVVVTGEDVPETVLDVREAVALVEGQAALGHLLGVQKR